MKFKTLHCFLLKLISSSRDQTSNTVVYNGLDVGIILAETKHSLRRHDVIKRRHWNSYTM